MKIFAAFLVFVFAAASSAALANTPAAILDVEKKIAYQQGQFGALYARCGSPDERQAVIGGSLAVWRNETFRGLNATSPERASVEKAFDEAAKDVALDGTACRDWIKKAAASWHGVVALSQNGSPATANP